MTLCTSDTDNKALKAQKCAFIYLLCSLFCLCFGAVYIKFSHNVYSPYMIYSFAFPLVGGVLPFMCISVFKIKKVPCAASRYLWHCMIATFTVGSIFKGVIEIYGTTSSMSVIYIIAGAILLAASVVLAVLDLTKKHNEK